MAKQNKTSVEAKTILKEFADRKYKPVYLLHGDENFFRDQICSYLLDNALPQEQQAFNLFQVYGRDLTGGQVADMASRVPMNAPFILIVVREAQELKALRPLAQYCLRPNPQAVVVLNYSQKYKPGQGKSSDNAMLLAAIKGSGVVFESAPLRDYEVASWVEEYVKEQGLTIAPRASQMLTYQLGTDLARVANEVKKLQIGMPPEVHDITETMVAETIGMSKEFNPFELTKAIGTGNLPEAIRIATNMAANPKGNEAPVILATLHSYFVKVFRYSVLQDKRIPEGEIASRLGVHPFFLREYAQAAARYSLAKCANIFSLLRSVDMQSKGFGASVPYGDMLRETIIRIMR